MISLGRNCGIDSSLCNVCNSALTEAVVKGFVPGTHFILNNIFV